MTTPLAQSEAAPTRSPTEHANAAPAPRSRIVAWHAWSLLAAITITAVHYGFAHPGSGPRIFADEIGYLANARYLAGGRMIDMSQTAFYDGGYALVLTPISRVLASHPARLYESVLFFQALMSGASMLLIAQLCRWLLGTPRGVSIVVAFAAVLYPAFVANSGFTWAESMLTFGLLFVITSAVWLMRCAEAPTRARFAMSTRAVITGTACGFLVTVHNRTVLAVLATLAVVAWSLLRRRALVPIVILLVVSAITAGAGELLNKHLQDAMWAGNGGIDAGGKLSSLFHPHGLWAAGLTLAGQYWAQLVATGGLVAIGLAGLTLVALGRSGEPRTTPPIESRRLGAAIVVAVFVSLLVVAATFLAQGDRADMIVYGRYVDIVTPLLIALAIAWLATSPPARALAYAAAGLAASLGGAWIVLAWAGKTELARVYNRVTTFAILGWLDYRRNSPALFRASVWTAAIGLTAIAVAFVARKQPARSWTAPAAISLGMVIVFVWQLSFVGPKVLTGLSQQSAKTRAVVGAINTTETKELRLESTITVVDRLALEYWLPNVTFSAATPATDRCSTGVSLRRTVPAGAGQVLPPTGTAVPAPGQVLIAKVGAFALFRGQARCQG